jgi:hypothetical protein
MTIAVDDYVYTVQASGPDVLGIEWLTLQRRVVEAIDGDTITLSRAVVYTFPDHSPPADLSTVRWELAWPASLVVFASMVGAGLAWDPAPDLGEEEAIDEATVKAALLDARNRRYTAQERGDPEPALTTEERRVLHIAEWRELKW